MSNADSIYVFVGICSFFLGIIFFFIDGMLIWSIGFFSLGIILVLCRMIWNISGWADNVVRKWGEHD